MKGNPEVAHENKEGAARGNIGPQLGTLYGPVLVFTSSKFYYLFQLQQKPWVNVPHHF